MLYCTSATPAVVASYRAIKANSAAANNHVVQQYHHQQLQHQAQLLRLSGSASADAAAVPAGQTSGSTWQEPSSHMHTPPDCCTQQQQQHSTMCSSSRPSTICVHCVLNTQQQCHTHSSCRRRCLRWRACRALLLIWSLCEEGGRCVVYICVFPAFPFQSCPAQPSAGDNTLSALPSSCRVSCSIVPHFCWSHYQLHHPAGELCFLRVHACMLPCHSCPACSTTSFECIVQLTQRIGCCLACTTACSHSCAVLTPPGSLLPWPLTRYVSTTEPEGRAGGHKLWC